MESPRRGTALAALRRLGVSRRTAVNPAVAAAFTQDPERVRRAVEEVFRDPALQRGLDTRDPSGELVNLLQAIWSWWLSLIDGLDALRLSSPLWYWLLFVLLIVVLVLMIWHIVYTLRRALGGGRDGAPHQVAEAEARRQRSAELYRESVELAAAGRYRDAARHLLLSLLALLDEREIVRVAQGWTNREILARVRDRRGEARLLESFGAEIEASSYGGRELGGGDYARLDESFLRLRDGLGGTRR